MQTNQYRKAQTKDAQALTDLMRRAKAHWGYPKQWMQQWESDLTVSPEWIEHNTAELLMIDQKIMGYYGIEYKTDHAYLEHLWIDPDFIGSGCGKTLFLKACQTAKDNGFSLMELNADPNAQGFYAHMGAVKVGELHGEILGVKRTLPIMHVDLNNQII